MIWGYPYFWKHPFQPSQGFNQVLGEDVWSSFSGKNKTKQNIQTGSRVDMFDECNIGTLDPVGVGMISEWIYSMDSER